MEFVVLVLVTYILYSSHQNRKKELFWYTFCRATLAANIAQQKGINWRDAAVDAMGTFSDYREYEKYMKKLCQAYHVPFELDDLGHLISESTRSKLGRAISEDAKALYSSYYEDFQDDV